MKRAISILLTLVMVLSLVPVASAASSEATQAAEALHSMGLFQGKGTNADGTPIYALDDTTSRSEAVTMLVRLLGKEAEAKAGTWNIPFTDVDSWAVPYVGYAYTNGLTKGTSETTFGGNELVSATQYLTFVLRALGYQSGDDFQWDKAWLLSDKIGVTNGQYSADTPFLRGDVAIISFNALSAKMNGEDKTLLSSHGLTNNENSNVDQPEKANASNLIGIWSGNHNVGGSFGETWLRSDGTYTHISVTDSEYSSNKSYECGTYIISGSSITFNRILFVFATDKDYMISDENRTFNFEISEYFEGLNKIEAHPVHDSAYPVLAKYVNVTAGPSFVGAMDYEKLAMGAIAKAANISTTQSYSKYKIEREFNTASKYINKAKEGIIESRKYWIMNPEWQSKIDQICGYFDKMLSLSATYDSIFTWRDYLDLILDLQTEIVDEITADT